MRNNRGISTSARRLRGYPGMAATYLCLFLLRLFSYRLELRLYSFTDGEHGRFKINASDRMKGNLHLLLDEIQSLLDRLLSFSRVLGHQPWPDQLIYRVLWSQLFEFLTDRHGVSVDRKLAFWV